jgi:hypothetical protein
MSCKASFGWADLDPENGISGQKNLIRQKNSSGHKTLFGWAGPGKNPDEFQPSAPPTGRKETSTPNPSKINARER